MTFNQKLHELVQDLHRARASYEAWWNLKNKPMRTKYTDTMNEYSEYFRVAIHSHFVAMLMALFRLYDICPTALSVPNQGKALQSEPGVPGRLRTSLELELKRGQASIDKVLLLRHKVFAHRDRTYTYERAFKEARLSPDEVRRLLERTLRIINRLLKTRKQGEHTFERNTERDIRNLLRDLHGFQRGRRGP